MLYQELNGQKIKQHLLIEKHYNTGSELLKDGKSFYHLTIDYFNQEVIIDLPHHEDPGDGQWSFAEQNQELHRCRRMESLGDDWKIWSTNRLICSPDYNHAKQVDFHFLERTVEILHGDNGLLVQVGFCGTGFPDLEQVLHLLKGKWSEAKLCIGNRDSYLDYLYYRLDDEDLDQEGQIYHIQNATESELDGNLENFYEDYSRIKAEINEKMHEDWVVVLWKEAKESTIFPVSTYYGCLKMAPVIFEDEEL